MLTGRRVTAVEVPEPHRHLVDLNEAVGLACRQVRRRGKIVIVDLYRDAADRFGPAKELVVHLGMTGRLLTGTPSGVTHLRARIHLDGGEAVSFSDPRRFGRLLVCDPGRYPTLPLLAEIGPDPADCDPLLFAAALSRTSRTVKACLLDQRLIAGVGNIYADEALHRAAISPAAPACSLGSGRAQALLAAVVRLLEEAVAAGGTTVRDYRHADGSVGAFQQQLRVYDRSGLPCLTCGTALQRAPVAQRSTVWCPACQPPPA